jgi:hypothetical protein
VQEFLVGGPTTFTVPAGVTRLQVGLYGAGGFGRTYWQGGGAGAYVRTVLTVTPGDLLNVFVGAGVSCTDYYASGGDTYVAEIECAQGAAGYAVLGYPAGQTIGGGVWATLSALGQNGYAILSWRPASRTHSQVRPAQLANQIREPRRIGVAQSTNDSSQGSSTQNTQGTRSTPPGDRRDRFGDTVAPDGSITPRGANTPGTNSNSQQ